MAEQDHDSVGRQDRVIRVDENGLLVGSLDIPGEPVTICVTHGYVAYWDAGGPVGICNTCGQLRPKQAFGRDYPEGRCPMCGAPAPDDAQAAEAAVAPPWTGTEEPATPRSWIRRKLDALGRRDAGDHDSGPSTAAGDADDRAGGEALAERERLSPQDLQEILDDELAKAEAEEARWRAEHEALMKRHHGPSAELLAVLRPAERTDYEGWMEGYLQSGRRPSHAYTYPFPRGNWYVATADFTAEPLFGANAVEIIVPTGVQWSAPAGLGHCNLYLMENHANVGHWVPIYRDMRFV
jgi:hypothetical protein